MGCKGNSAGFFTLAGAFHRLVTFLQPLTIERQCMDILIAAFYQFAPLYDFEEFQKPLMELCQENNIYGTILLAGEGINGTIAGPESGILEVFKFLRDDYRFQNLEYKESRSAENPFFRMKVKLKKEIIPIGDHPIDPVNGVGTYVEPEDWNRIISDPDVLVLDTRNDYEIEIGTFKGAVNPDLETFREFTSYVEGNLNPHSYKKVAMFCTGGIRCEKASAYMKSKGFSEVYHLRGGILKYLEKIPSGESLWEGECFVFDNRVSVDHELHQGKYDMCPNCRWPVSDEEKKTELYVEGICCSRCHATLTEERRQSLAERQKQIELARLKGKRHLGDPLESSEAK